MQRITNLLTRVSVVAIVIFIEYINTASPLQHTVAIVFINAKVGTAQVVVVLMQCVGPVRQITGVAEVGGYQSRIGIKFTGGTTTTDIGTVDHVRPIALRRVDKCTGSSIDGNLAVLIEDCSRVTGEVVFFKVTVPFRRTGRRKKRKVHVVAMTQLGELIERKRRRGKTRLLFDIVNHFANKAQD